MNPAIVLLSSSCPRRWRGSSSFCSLPSKTSPPSLLSEGEEAVLHIFNDLNNYHINCISLLKMFENTDRLRSYRKARAVPGASPVIAIRQPAEKQERPGEVPGFHSLLSIYVRNIILIALFFIIAIPATAQTKQTTHVQQIWTAYNNQTRFSNKWGAWADLHLRTKEDFFTNFSQSIIRLGLIYYLDDDAKLTAGYAWINHFPADNHKNISQPEHRPWQQLQWHTRFPKLRLMQWFRLEERYRRKILNNDQLASGYNFNFRLRYNFFSQFPLSKKRFQPKTLSFVVNDEVHINFGKQIVNNYFDQNRFFLGFAYHVNKSDNVQVGYMNLFQQLAAGNQYKSIHVARVFYFHNVDLRRKK